MTTLDELIDEHNPCGQARTWLEAEGITTPEQAWEKCRNPTWLLWWLDKIGYRDERVMRLWGCWSVRQIWDQLTDARSRRGVEVSERYASGLATEEEFGDARAAAIAAHAAAKPAHAEWTASMAARGQWVSASWGAARLSESPDDACAAQCDRLRELINPPFGGGQS